MGITNFSCFVLVGHRVYPSGKTTTTVGFFVRDAENEPKPHFRGWLFQDGN